MSGALDITARASAEKLLKKFGKVATYRKESTTPYDPTTGNPPTTTTTDYPITAYISKPTEGQIKAGLATITDAIILVSAKELGVDVEPENKIIFPHATYSVKMDDPIWSGEEIALHKIVSVRA